MKILNPNEIGVKISTLIAEAKEKFYVVSPFINLSNWKKITINLEKAVLSGVKIKFFVREIGFKDRALLESLGIEIILIEGLHTKLYLNEREIIVSSMNLYEFSDLHSIELAISYKKQNDYKRLFDYFETYICNDTSGSIVQSALNGKKLELMEIADYLGKVFPDFRINIASTYLYSTNLFKNFHVFIEPYYLTMKYPVSNPGDLKIEKMSKLIQNHYQGEVIIERPSNVYSYCCWKIPYEDNSLSTISKTILVLQGKLNYSVFVK